MNWAVMTLIAVALLSSIKNIAEVESGKSQIAMGNNVALWLNCDTDSYFHLL